MVTNMRRLRVVNCRNGATGSRARLPSGVRPWRSTLASGAGGGTPPAENPPSGGWSGPSAGRAGAPVTPPAAWAAAPPLACGAPVTSAGRGAASAETIGSTTYRRYRGDSR